MVLAEETMKNVPDDFQGVWEEPEILVEVQENFLLESAGVGLMVALDYQLEHHVAECLIGQLSHRLEKVSHENLVLLLLQIHLDSVGHQDKELRLVAEEQRGPQIRQHPLLIVLLEQPAHPLDLGEARIHTLHVEPYEFVHGQHPLRPPLLFRKEYLPYLAQSLVQELLLFGSLLTVPELLYKTSQLLSYHYNAAGHENV